MNLYFELMQLPVFTIEDVSKYYDEDKIESARSAVKRLRKQGIVVKIRNNMYTCISGVDFVPNYDREDMELAREKITQILKEYMLQEGYQISPASRFSFSLDVFHFQYQNTGGNRDVIKIEINYSLRTYIFESVKCKIITDVFEDEKIIQRIKEHPMAMWKMKY